MFFDKEVRVINGVPFLETTMSCGGHIRGERYSRSCRLDPPGLHFIIDGELESSSKIKHFDNHLTEDYIRGVENLCKERGIGVIEPIGFYDGSDPRPHYYISTGNVEYLDKETARAKRQEQLILIREIEKFTRKFIKEHFQAKS